MLPSQNFKSGRFQSCHFECLLLRTVFSNGFLLLLTDLKSELHWDYSAWHYFIVTMCGSLITCDIGNHAMGCFSSNFRDKDEIAIWKRNFQQEPRGLHLSVVWGAVFHRKCHSYFHIWLLPSTSLHSKFQPLCSAVKIPSKFW